MELADVFRIQMNELNSDHPNEEALERFLLHRLSEEELESVETHILACESCVEALEVLEVQIATTKMALETLEALPKGKPVFSAPWKSWLTLPRLSIATAFAALASVSIIFSTPRAGSPTAYRGTQS